MSTKIGGQNKLNFLDKLLGETDIKGFIGLSRNIAAYAIEHEKSLNAAVEKNYQKYDWESYLANP